jgi:hypothetical protein
MQSKISAVISTLLDKIGKMGGGGQFQDTQVVTPQKF